MRTFLKYYVRFKIGMTNRMKARVLDLMKTDDAILVMTAREK